MHFFRLKNKGQLAPFMTLVIVIIILAVAATALIGEFAYERVRLANAADAAALSAGAELARSLNLIRKIHFQMFLNYIYIQVYLLGLGVIGTTKADVTAAIAGFAVNEGTNLSLFNQAVDAGHEAIKNVRATLYERLFGGLVDEPKPFHYQLGTTKLDYESYLNEPNIFARKFLDFKKSNPGSYEKVYTWKNITHWSMREPGWYSNDKISYSWNKGAVGPAGNKRFIGGTLVPGGEPATEKEGVPYTAHLKVNITAAPSDIRVKPQFMLLFFLWNCGVLIGMPGCICPGLVPFYPAWIRKIEISPASRIGCEVTKLPFRTFPYFLPAGRPDAQKELVHSNEVRINGSIWQGYDIRMTR